MTDYVKTKRQVRKLRDELTKLTEIAMTIEDESPHLMTIRTLIPSLAAKCDRYLAGLENRHRISKRMKR